MFTDTNIFGVSGDHGLYGDFVYGEYGDSVGYEDEEWAPIGDGYYVSTCGRVWSSKTKKFMKAKRLDNHGHVGIAMHNPGEKPMYKYLHRLVADAFLDNSNSYPIVRHMNDDPEDNDIDNLAWGTQKDNMRDCIENGRFYYPTAEDRDKGNEKRKVRVVAIHEATGERLHFDSINEASRSLGLQQANVCKVLNGERRHTCGYVFKRDDER